MQPNSFEQNTLQFRLGKLLWGKTLFLWGGGGYPWMFHLAEHRAHPAIGLAAG